MNARLKATTKLGLITAITIAIYFGLIAIIAPLSWLPTIILLAAGCELGIIGWWYGAQR